MSLKNMNIISKMNLDMKVACLVLVITLILSAIQIVPVIINNCLKSKEFNKPEYISYLELSDLKRQKSNELLANSNLQKEYSIQSANPEQEGIPTLIEFYSSYPPESENSKAMLEEVGRQCKGKIDVRFVDVGLRKNTQLYLNNDIQSLPTQIIYDSKGREIYRNRGYILSTEKMIKIFEMLNII